MYYVCFDGASFKIYLYYAVIHLVYICLLLIYHRYYFKAINFKWFYIVNFCSVRYTPDSISISHPGVHGNMHVVQPNNIVISGPTQPGLGGFNTSNHIMFPRQSLPPINQGTGHSISGSTSYHDLIMCIMASFLGCTLHWHTNWNMHVL